MAVAETQAGKTGRRQLKTEVLLNGKAVVEVSPPAQQIIDAITGSPHPVSKSWLATTVFPEQLPYQTKPPQNGVVWTRTQERLDDKVATASDMANLVTLAQQGSMEAFGSIYGMLHSKIVSYLRYHLGGRLDIAQDLAEDVFLKAMEKLDTYQARDSTPFTAWLYRIAHNHLIDYLRTDKRGKEPSLERLFDVAGLMTQELEVVDIEEVALAKVEVEAIIQLTRSLTPDQREVICHRFLEDRSIADTARVMGKSEDAVKQLRNRALNALRRLIRDSEENQATNLIR